MKQTSPVSIAIFDFDGTIADSFEKTLSVTIQIMKDYGIDGINKKFVSLYRNNNIKNVIKEAKIPLYKVPFIIKKGQHEVSKVIKNVKPFKGMDNLIRDLKRKGLKLGILTTNSEYNVKQFLKINNINAFDFIYTGSSLFGKGKFLKKIIKMKKFIPEKTIYIGDETRDIKAAKEAGVKSVAVTWGFNNKKLLLKEKPDFIVDKPEDLLVLVS